MYCVLVKFKIRSETENLPRLNKFNTLDGPK